MSDNVDKSDFAKYNLAVKTDPVSCGYRVDKSEFTKYILTIKTAPISYGYRDGSYIPYSKRREIAAKRFEELKRDFILVANKVVSLGGVLCLGKRDLNRNIYVDKFEIKVGSSYYQTISELSQVESLYEVT